MQREVDLATQPSQVSETRDFRHRSSLFSSFPRQPSQTGLTHSPLHCWTNNTASSQIQLPLPNKKVEKETERLFVRPDQCSRFKFFLFPGVATTFSGMQRVVGGNDSLPQFQKKARDEDRCDAGRREDW